MRIVRSPLHVGGDKNWVAIGKWDGLHIGHQQLVRNLVKKAKDHSSQSVVIGFDRHPTALFNPGNEPLQLQSIEERSVWLKELGVDVYLVIPFTKQFASHPPEYFVNNILINDLRTQDITIGYNFRFGNGRKGTPALLKRLCKPFGVGVHVIPPIYIDDEIVSSTLIRSYLETGNIEKVQRLLGHRALLAEGHRKNQIEELYQTI